jgi:hypothetical protein
MLTAPRVFVIETINNFLMCFGYSRRARHAALELSFLGREIRYLFVRGVENLLFNAACFVLEFCSFSLYF